MKSTIEAIVKRILEGQKIDYEEATKLIEIDNENQKSLNALFEGANKIRDKYMGKKVDLCTIMNVKSGKCSEDCKFCAQSSHFSTGIDEYSILNYDEVLKRAMEMEKSGVDRFSLVTSGKGLEGTDFEKIVQIYKGLNEDTKLKLCASHGVISYEQAIRLKEAGVSMYHHNVETSRDFYKSICTTHTYEERINTIKNVVKAGMEVCCGGIIGMGETRSERLDMAFEISNLGIKSIPINVLNPIPGTPLEKIKILTPMEILKTMAVFRYIVPNCFIRYAGGRIALKNNQQLGFKAGVNAALVGNYLTTVGSDIEEDKEMILCEGLEI